MIETTNREEFFENLRVLAAVSHGCVLDTDLGVLAIKYGVTEIERNEIEAYCNNHGIRIIDDETQRPRQQYDFRKTDLPKKEPERTEEEKRQIEENTKRIQDIEHLKEQYEILTSSILAEREIKILILRFGLDGKPKLSLQETADVFHVSRERIRQIEARALRKIRQKRGHLPDELIHE